jgi:DNA adenine methylase
MMKSDIFAVSALFKGKCTLTSLDYKQVLSKLTSNDLVYMDPPYQGTFVNGGFRYYGDINLEEFVESLKILSARQIPFVLSYDGRTGNKTFGEFLPAHLELTRIEVNAGRSSQATLLGRSDTTFESVYISKALVQKLNFNKSIRRLDIHWEEHEIKSYDRIKALANQEKTPLPNFVKKVLDKSIAIK